MGIKSVAHGSFAEKARVVAGGRVAEAVCDPTEGNREQSEENTSNQNKALSTNRIATGVTATTTIKPAQTPV